MSKTFDRILSLVNQREAVISLHGYEELAAEGIPVKDILAGVNEAVIVEDYPKYHKGPCVLLLQKDLQGEPIHAVWGIPKVYPLRLY